MEYNRALVAAMLARDWTKFHRLTVAGIRHATQDFHQHQDYDYWLNRSADQMTVNSRYYVDKHKDLKGKALAAYLALVSAAELQMATSTTIKRIATGMVERITHPEKGIVCKRCRDLEGIHNADDYDLYWSHPNCHCEWRTVKL